MTRPPVPRSPDPVDQPGVTGTTVGPAGRTADAVARPLAGDEPAARRRLPPRVVACWRWALLVAAVPPVLLLVVLALVLPDDLALIAGVAWVLAALVLVGTAIAAVVVPPIRYTVFWYALSDDELDVGHGIVFRHRTVVPLHRVQSLRTERGPLARWFRLTNVRVRTAAGSVVINGLDENEADRVCALISGLANVRDDI